MKLRLWVEQEKFDKYDSRWDRWECVIISKPPVLQYYDEECELWLTIPTVKELENE